MARTASLPLLVASVLLVLFSSLLSGCDDGDSTPLLDGQCRTANDCLEGEICSPDGFCEVDLPCGGPCARGQVCNESTDRCEPADATDVVEDADPDDVTEDTTPPDVSPGDVDTTQPELPLGCNPPCTGNQVCQNGQCVSVSCGLQESDCQDPDRPFLNVETCQCVSCLNETQCEAGEVCARNGRCLVSTQPCQSRSDCGVNFCQSGYCVQCISNGDCSEGQFCNRGACGACTCDEGFVCDRNGRCIDESLISGACTTPADCVASASALGWQGDVSNLGCDPQLGCFVRGTCNSPAAGAQQPDPWAGQCAAGATCQESGGLGGGLPIPIPLPGLEAGFACACDPAQPEQCRAGEECRENTIELFPGFPLPGGDGHSCQGPSQGGGGFPLPF